VAIRRRLASSHRDQRPCQAAGTGRTLRTVIDVYFDALTSAADHLEIDRWCAVNDSRDVEYIVIDKPAVVVYGCTAAFVSVSGKVGRRGKLTGELDKALSAMRTARSR
jgi:hypothetical protein